MAKAMNWTGWLVLLLGVLMLLPLIGVAALGTLTTGALAWIAALVVIVLGILELKK